MHRTRILLFVSVILVAGCLLLVADVPPIRVGAHDEGDHCSAFVLANDGHGIFGANFDHSLTDEGLVFVNKRGVLKTSINGGATHGRLYWTSRYASVSFNLVGYEYAWGGMNEAGLSISTMSLNETRQPPPDELFDFDSNLNRRHFERFLDIWGVNLSPSSISRVLNHFEGFDCVRPHRRSSRRVAP